MTSVTSDCLDRAETLQFFSDSDKNQAPGSLMVTADEAEASQQNIFFEENK